jgi:hypothetical protein
MNHNLKEMMERDITQEQTSYLIVCLVYVQSEVGGLLSAGKQVDDELKEIALKLTSEIDRRVPIPEK